LLAALTDVLQGAGYQVVTATCAMDALNLVATQPFDLLITDIYMPDMDGIELILKLRNKHPQLTVIAMSGGGDKYNFKNGSLNIARKLGAVQVLFKPISSEQLLGSVSLALCDYA
jgi:two-component system chemotaxis response regulator CheY